MQPAIYENGRHKWRRSSLPHPVYKNKQPPVFTKPGRKKTEGVFPPPRFPKTCSPRFPGERDSLKPGIKKNAAPDFHYTGQNKGRRFFSHARYPKTYRPGFFHKTVQYKEGDIFEAPPRFSKTCRPGFPQTCKNKGGWGGAFATVCKTGGSFFSPRLSTNCTKTRGAYV